MGQFDSIYTYTDSILVDTIWVMTDSILNNTIPGNQAEFYDISFTTNENGCWQTINDSIEVYEVNAEIDLPIGLPGDQCAGYILNLQTMYDNYISTYEWSHTEFNKITEELILKFIPSTLIQLCLINLTILRYMIFLS